MTKKIIFLNSLPSRLNLLDREVTWISEILFDALAVSSIKGKEALKSFQDLNNCLPVKGEKAEESYFTLVKYALHFDYIALHSLFVTAHSIFENYILDFGSKIEEVSESKIKIADINSRNGDVDRIRKYLDLVHNFKSASNDTPEWLDLVKFNQIRNLITHNRNNLKNKNSDNAHLKPFLEKFGAHITTAGVFQIRDIEFVESFKATVLSFTNDLANDCFRLFKEKKTEVER